MFNKTSYRGPKSPNWLGAPEHPQEAERLVALQETGLVGAPVDQLDELVVQLAARICRTPIAAVSLVDADRQHFIASCGLSVNETPREVAFCAHTILQSEILIVSDATKDKRFAGNPLVTGDPGIRFYAGVPLMTQDRLPLGSLCVIDSEPRTLDAEQIDSLKTLAELVSNQFELRRRNRQLLAAERKQKEIGDRLNKIALRVPGMLYEFRRRPNGMFSFPYVSEGLHHFAKIDPEQLKENAAPAFESVHPDDLPAVLASIDQSARTLQEWRCEYRIRHADGTLHWMLGNSIPEREADGGTLWHGYLTDITKTKQAESELALAKASTERLAEIARRTSNAVIITDAKGCIEWVNEGFTRITGYTLEDIYGRTLSLFLQGPDSDPTADARMLHAFATGTSVTTEIVNHHKDGRAYTVFIEIIPLYDDSGTLTGFMAIESDITEQKAALEILRVERERLEMAATSAQMGLWDWNPQTGVVQFDERWAAMLGYRLDELKPHVSEWSDRVHPDDLPTATKAVQQAIRYDTHYSTEIRMRSRDGSWRWILAQGRIVTRDANGEVTRFVGSHLDITERKQTELELTRATAMLERTGELAKVGGWSVDLETMKLSWTLQTFRIADIEPPHEPDLETGINLFAPEARPVIAAAVQAAIDTGTPYDLELPLITPKGRHLWVRTQGYAELQDGKPIRIYGTFQDITESRQAKMDLLEITERFKLATLAGGVGTWEYELLDNKLSWDDQMFRLYGTTHEQFSGSVEAWSARVQPEDRTRLRFEIQQAVQGVKPFDTEFRIAWPNGSTKYIRGIATVQRNEAGQAVRMVGTNWDVTEQKLAEEQLRNANTKLEAARHAAEAANRAKSAFLANMSHEIRTPLTAILGFTDLLRDEGNISQAPHRRVHSIDTIKNAGQHLLTIINDILDLSKIEADKMTVERIDTSLIEVLGEVESLMRPRAIGKGLTLKVVLSTPIPQQIMSDPTRLRQMLLNLTGNAVKFTEAGGVIIRAGVANYHDKPVLIIDIEDTGRGMTSEQATRLFQPFEQADETMTREFGGTGLGLTICRRLAELMGGDAKLLRTELGKGSCFRLSLPLETVPDSPIIQSWQTVTVQTRSAVSESSLKLNGRILLAEDGSDNQRLIAFVLKKAGATVEVADNGLIALEMHDKAQVAGTPFDLLVTDMQMPEMDGYTLAHTLRDRGSRLPIIALTAHAMPEDRQACLDAGCDDYTTKPIDRAKLVAVCKLWIERGQSGSPAQV